ncbi:MAG: nucleotide exchange factor GrpE [Candidatus Woesearchaeota archaeon]
MINITKDNSKKTEEKTSKQEIDENITEVAKETKKDINEYTKDLEISELTDTLKRLQAEFENYKKRVDKENIITIKNANLNLIKELLPVLDSFELALKSNTNENAEIAKYRKGLELIYSQLYSILETHGLRIIDTKNKKFDPFRHEVLLVKECDLPDDTIIQEFQKGYFLNETIIRHSKVMIAKYNKENIGGQ